ncbi:lambda exonuclease family protein [Massilia endophytica]|uniref:lambda exonuclease family protein n=1 Tax=Massilia endophytica TaxID=2899220 RepID=UPI001E34FD5B|nr:lambda exonuclease family protein [Massilia endophytica]UGQ44941.1 YqaJ viral recombinase family protein [Massilia endophytica]
MKFIEVPQGSPDWLQMRAGLITASRFADAVSVCTRKSTERNVGDPTAVAERYAADVAMERISGRPHGEPVKAWVLERGHEMESVARRLYEARPGQEAFVTEAGICIDDRNVFAYSSDGLVERDGLIEVKAPIDTVKIAHVLETGDVSEYIHQMQGGMWITEREWCDFIMYVPELAPVKRDLYVKRIHRDEAFIADMATRLEQFNDLVGRYERIFRKQAA